MWGNSKPDEFPVSGENGLNFPVATGCIAFQLVVSYYSSDSNRRIR